MTAPLDALTTAIASAAEKVGPSVVGINRYGSGIVVADGFVVTNAHNLRGPGVAVFFADDKWVKGEPTGIDVDGDLTVIAVDTSGIEPVTWSEETVKLGQGVIALSNPRGRGIRATVGTVSSTGRGFRGPRGRRIPGSIEHTAPLARGSSGGPVLDLEGRVVGINTHRVEEGFYLALAVSAELRQRIDALSHGVTPIRPRLGAAIAPPDATRRLREAAGLPEVEGLLVRGIEEGSAAEQAGLRRGDVLTEAGGRPLTSVDDLYEALDSAGEELEIKLVRAIEELVVTVRFSAGGDQTA
jgi:serine protease Do